MKKYNIGLDILRVTAMLAVLFCHFFQRVDGGTIGGLFVAYGLRGVQIFFVMSGYLNMVSYEKRGKIWDYYRSRFKRFFPSYWMVLIIIMISNRIMKVDIPKDVTHLGYIRYFLGINQIVPSEEYYWYNLYGFWTIGSFLLFYLIVPFIYKYFNSFNKSLLLLALGYAVQLLNNKVYNIARFIWQSEPQSEFIGGTPFHELYVFYIGVCVYWAVRESKRNQLSLLMIAIMLIGIIMGKNHYLWAAMTGLYIEAADVIEINNRKIVSIIKVLSKYSFSVYLVHLFIINALFEIEYTAKASGTIYTVIFFTVLCAMTVIVTDVPNYIIRKLKV